MPTLVIFSNTVLNRQRQKSSRVVSGLILGLDLLEVHIYHMWVQIMTLYFGLSKSMAETQSRKQPVPLSLICTVGTCGLTPMALCKEKLVPKDKPNHFKIFLNYLLKFWESYFHAGDLLTFWKNPSVWFRPNPILCLLLKCSKSITEWKPFLHILVS